MCVCSPTALEAGAVKSLRVKTSLGYTIRSCLIKKEKKKRKEIKFLNSIQKD